MNINSLIPSAKSTPTAKNPEELKKETRQRTAQEWLPIADVDNSLTIRKDGYLTATIRVFPINIELLSENEQRRKVAVLSEQLNGEKQPLQIFIASRPVDLDKFLNWQEEKIRGESFAKKKTALKLFNRSAATYARSGDAREQHFYIIIREKNSTRKSKEDLLYRAGELVNKLRLAELDAKICSDDEVIDLYALFSAPSQAAFERTEKNWDLPSVVKI